MVYLFSAVAAALVFSAALYFYLTRYKDNAPYFYGAFLLISGLALGFSTILAIFHAAGVKI